MDENTELAVRLIASVDLQGREDLIGQAKLAFVDYLAALLAARQEPAVKKLSRCISADRPEDKALLYGFASHFLDFDDAQANLTGHFSTVLYSALLAAACPEDSVHDFLAAYIAGAELEGLLGKRLNPEHRRQGWHATGTIGVLGAAAALSRLHHWQEEKAAMVLSLAATQSAGMAFEAGSDGKPLHAGFAAAHALQAACLVEAGLTARTNLFNDETGCLAVFSDRRCKFAKDKFQSDWLSPGQVIRPGLWMKCHMYCSAAICAADGAEKLYKEGLRMADVESLTAHFPPGADRALRYQKPQTGREGQFSVEYVIWQVLTYGHIDDAAFRRSKVPAEFLKDLLKIQRAYDVPALPLAERAVPLTALTRDGRQWQADVRDPQGSPARPLTFAQEKEKLEMAAGNETAARIVKDVGGWPEGTLGHCIEWIEGAIFDETTK